MHTHEYMQVPGPEIWIGFSALAQRQFAVNFHAIYIYFSDPALVDRLFVMKRGRACSGR
jgi:hypothetical protein